MDNELVPVEQVGDVPALIPPDPFAALTQVQCFLDCDTPSRVAQLGKAVQIDECNFPDALTCVDAIGLTIFTRQVTPAGELPVRYGVYLALHCADGRNYITASGGVFGFASALAGAYGRPPWPRGEKVTIGRAEKKAGKIPRCIVAPGDCTVREM